MTGRAVPEWIGPTPDTPAPTRVRLRVFEAHGGRCYLTGRKIGPGDTWELEHVKPLHLGGENRETNLAPALAEAHREKTSREMTAKAKADRIRARHLGIRPPTRRKIPSRPFPKSRPEVSFNDER